MQHVPEPDGRGNTVHPVPHDESRTLVQFPGFILDIDACRLDRDDGQTVALTRGEFSLLRFFLSRGGRVISRETLLNELSNRRFDPFDRSVDTAVGRLRRKIEADPSQPRLIVTVPGEGYRFDGRTSLLAKLPSGEKTEPYAPAESAPAGSLSAETLERMRERSRRSPRLLTLSATLILLVCLGLSWEFLRQSGFDPDDPPTVAVLPFDNLTGDSGKDYLSGSLSLEVATLLGTYPGLKVVAPPDSNSASAAKARRKETSAGIRYVLRSGIHRFGDSLRVTATLYDTGTRSAVWAQIFDGNAAAPAPQKDIPQLIYDSLAGFHGAIQRSEERTAWQRPTSSLNDYDYYLRGASLYLRFDLNDVLTARAIFQQGLLHCPDSVLLRVMIAWTHLWVAMNEPGLDPSTEIDNAWRFADEASSAHSFSPLEAWLRHWLMAYIYQWHDNDFPRSVAEALDATKLAPYDAFSRSDLSWILANAGHADEAIEWARFALQHDPAGPSRYHANLAWAYLIAGREREGIDVLYENSSEFPILSAALYVRLGEIEKARTLVAQYVQSGGTDTVHWEDMVPLIEPVGTEYVEILRKTGLREN